MNGEGKMCPGTGEYWKIRRGHAVCPVCTRAAKTLASLPSVQGVDVLRGGRVPFHRVADNPSLEAVT